jgi:hypothetical protein
MYPTLKDRAASMYGRTKLVTNAQTTLRAAPRDAVFSRTALFGTSAARR